LNKNPAILRGNDLSYLNDVLNSSLSEIDKRL